MMFSISSRSLRQILLSSVLVAPAMLMSAELSLAQSERREQREPAEKPAPQRAPEAEKPAAPKPPPAAPPAPAPRREPAPAPSAQPTPLEDQQPRRAPPAARPETPPQPRPAAPRAEDQDDKPAAPARRPASDQPARERSQTDKPATPATPATPARPSAVPGTPATPATPVTPAVPARPPVQAAPPANAKPPAQTPAGRPTTDDRRTTQPSGAQTRPESQPGAARPSAQPPASSAAPTPAPPAAGQVQTGGRRDPQPDVRRVEDLRERREQRTENNGRRTVIVEPGNRRIIREEGRVYIRHDPNERLRISARDAQVRRDGNRNIVTIVRPDGTRVVTVQDEYGRVIRRTVRRNNGPEIILIDDRSGRRRTAGYRTVLPLAAPVIGIAMARYIVDYDEPQPELAREVLFAPPVQRLERAYTLDEIVSTPNLRAYMPRIDLTTVTFETGQWEIGEPQGRALQSIASVINAAIEKNPREVFLIEGHTDTVGPEEDNLSLSDRRAASVAEALTRLYNVPPENIVTQGYGESQLKVQVEGDERANRRVTMRRITPLLAGEQITQPQRR